ncbi:MAG: helix-turn-helix domain-containing protein [Candidatus Omnitrophica bacterium]|nr:helix-turn-helix domain-containing protein [Candidatus Omnitrophota bacterium]
MAVSVNKRFLNVEELAEFLGIAEGTVYVWVCHRKIPFLKVGRLVKFDLRKIEKWLEQKSVEMYN